MRRDDGIRQLGRICSGRRYFVSFFPTAPFRDPPVNIGESEAGAGRRPRKFQRDSKTSCQALKRST
eukprot:3695623-Rhodomonas_salina.3